MIPTNKFLLPTFLQNNLTAIKIHQYLSALGKSSGYFSSIVYSQNNKLYFLTKDKDFPYVPFDWTMYTLMRSGARTIITSGPTLRKELWLYQESLGTFGKQDIKKIYQQNLHEPYNLVVYTKTMSPEQIKEIICEKWFKYVPVQQLFEKDLQKGEIQFYDIAKQVNKRQMGPTIYENGQQTLHSAFDSVSEGESNFVELVVLSLFEGQMPQKYISHQYNVQTLQNDFEKIWESQKIDSTAKQADKQVPITLKFVIYKRKQKINKKEHS